MFAKLRERRSREHRRHVDYGAIWCPARGSDIDIEACFECDAFERVGESDDGTFVQCRPFRPPPSQLGWH